MSNYSVVITAYNAEKYIGQCLCSALTQTHEALEVIVIDDCSTDGTEKIIKEFCGKDPRVRYLKPEGNIGVAAARNLGVSVAKGKWIALLDMDDAWEPDKIELQFKALRQSGLKISCTGAQCISENGAPLNNIFTTPPVITYEELLKNNLITCSSVLIKRDLIERYPMEKSSLHEDYICWLKILKDGYLVCGVDKPLTLYRIRKNSRSYNKLLSAIKYWKSLSYVHVPFIKRAGCFFHYAVHGIRRYFK